MSSDRRAQASRENGAKSRGPVSAEGKARSALNSLRHGLLARDVLIQCEHTESFNKHMAAYLKRLQPANDLELELVQEMGANAWRLHRARALEASIIEKHTDEFLETDGGRTTDGHTLIMEGFSRALNTSLMNLTRYETRLSRQVDRAFNMLIKLRECPVLQIPDEDIDGDIEPIEPASPPDPGPAPESATPAETAGTMETKSLVLPNEPNAEPQNSPQDRVITLSLVTKKRNMPKY